MIEQVEREGNMPREKRVELILAASPDNRLSCERAHDLAREMNITLQELGALCNELKIKITACQLGCF
jgi:hypothetical protein